MPFKPVILWTDALIDILMISAFIFIYLMSRHEHWRNAWMQLIRNRLGMASLVILLCYVLIGFMDSLHYRAALPLDNARTTQHYSTEVKSVLDKILAPLGQQYEETYSSPFATETFVKKIILQPDGTRINVYPRLEFGGADLKNPAQDFWPDVIARSLTAMLLAVLVWLFISSLIIWGSNRKQHLSFIKFGKKIIFRTTPTAWLSFLLTLLVMLMIVFITYSLSREYHILGTDKIGQDIFYQAVKSIRTGLVIGTLTTLVMLPFALLLGTFAGYFGGWIDDVIQYVYTTLNSIPGVLLIAAAVLSLQIFIGNHEDIFTTIASRADARLLALCFILGITSWTGLCRLLRGEALKLREMEYIQAAKALGGSNFKIIRQHILPNVMHIILIAIVLDFSGLVLAEAVLSYVGVGVDATTFSWGNMINAARLQLAREPIVWWPLFAAFVFMFVLVLAANLFSDAVRDAFDPRIRAR